MIPNAAVMCVSVRPSLVDKHDCRHHLFSLSVFIDAAAVSLTLKARLTKTNKPNREQKATTTGHKQITSNGLAVASRYDRSCHFVCDSCGTHSCGDHHV